MEPQPETRGIKRLIWLYFWLLIFEGAFRKWIVPSLSSPLLIVRDPVVLAIYAMAFSRGLFPKNGFVKCIIALAVIDAATSLGGIGNWKVTIFGLHADFLHLPLIFVVASVFNRDDVRKMGGACLLVLFPMTAIALQQFRAAPDAWINVGAGGEVGGQLFASAEKVRPSGLFSFVTGMVSFLAVVTAFLLERFLRERIARWSLPFFAIPTLVLALAVSASRSAVGGAVIVIFFALVCCLRQRRLFGKALVPLALATLAYFGLQSVRVFHEGLMVHRERFQGAGGVREGMVDRFADDLLSSFHAADITPAFGYGIGVGTNAGAGLLSGERQFLLAEGEWSRVVLENGAILGFAFIFLRLMLALSLVRVSWRALGTGNALPLLLFGACVLELTTGQFGQPATLGFVVLVTGLGFAATKEGAQLPARAENPEPPASQKKTIGRGPLAEALHREA
jgi:hypothetical protein